MNYHCQQSSQSETTFYFPKNKHSPIWKTIYCITANFCFLPLAFTLPLLYLSPQIVSLLSQNASDNLMDSTCSDILSSYIETNRCLEMSGGDICCYLVFWEKIKLGRPFTSRVALAMLYPVSLLQGFISV